MLEINKNMVHCNGRREEILEDIKRYTLSRDFSSPLNELDYKQLKVYVEYLVWDKDFSSEFWNIAKGYDFFSEGEWIEREDINEIRWKTEVLILDVILDACSDSKKFNFSYKCEPDYHYYVNLKASTVLLLAMLIDTKMGTGVASTLVVAIGLNTKTFARISDFEGESCVLIEICRQKGRKGDASIYDEITGCECVNNDLTCKYRKEGCCTMTASDVERIFNKFVEKNVFSRKGPVVKYNP